MRVLLLIRELAHGGADPPLVELAIGLLRRGIQVGGPGFYSHPDGALERRLRGAGGTPHHPRQRGPPGGASPPMAVIANGIDTERFRPQPEPARALRAAWGVAETTPLIGAVGKLNEMKDWKTFVRAAALLRRRRPDVRFAWVGVAGAT